jgi:hypothetical protein
MKRYKFLRKGNKSENGNFKWKLGELYIHEGEIEMCKAGFHCSKGIYQAWLAAESAAWSAWLAAESAAWSAESAARSAVS